MGISLITERWSGDNSQQTSPDAKNYQLTAERVLDITVDDPLNDNSFTVMAAMLDPQIRNAYPLDYYLRCDDLKCERVTPNLFKLTAHYLTKAQLEQSPLDLPADVEYDVIVTEEEIDCDADGNHICTIVGESFDPPIRAPLYDTVVRVGRNLASYDDAWAKSFRNRVNSTDWGAYEAGSARVVSLKGQSVLDKDFQYARVTAEIQIRDAAPGSTIDKAWYRRVAAKGFWILDSGKPRRITAGDLNSDLTGDAAAQFATEPWFHDTTTGALIVSKDDAQFYEFKIFQTEDLNELGLI